MDLNYKNPTSINEESDDEDNIKFPNFKSI